jgi:hypothetical protein
MLTMKRDATMIAKRSASYRAKRTKAILHPLILDDDVVATRQKRSRYL